MAQLRGSVDQNNAHPSILQLKHVISTCACANKKGLFDARQQMSKKAQVHEKRNNFDSKRRDFNAK